MMMIRLLKVAVIFCIGYLALLHIGRYTWILEVIKRDGGIYLYEDVLTMLNFELMLGYGTAALVIMLIGYAVGAATR
jgi:hypothetical protein